MDIVLDSEDQPDVEDAFALDVRIVTEVGPGAAARCDTSNGCAPTCASSCVSE